MRRSETVAKDYGNPVIELDIRIRQFPAGDWANKSRFIVDQTIDNWKHIVVMIVR